MLSLNLLKMLLAGLGISGLKIEFDTDNQLVRATFDLAGQSQLKEIPFRDISDAFTDTDPMASAGPGSSANKPSGTLLPSSSE